MQLWLARLLPQQVALAAAASALLSVPVHTARWRGALTADSTLWRCWQAGTGLAGLVAVPQALWYTFTGAPSVRLAISAGSAGACTLSLISLTHIWGVH